MKQQDVRFIEKQPTGRYAEFSEVDIQIAYAPNRKATLAVEIIHRFALIAGKPDGEDSTGRQKHALIPADELVQHACNIADLAIDEMDRRGWFLEVPEMKRNPEFDK